MQGDKLSSLRWRWLLWLIALLLSAYIVPYALIGEISKVTASSLFWTLFAVVAIISIIRITSYWRD